MTHSQRIATLQGEVADQGWDGAILFYSRDLFYYTGMAQPGWLAITPDDYALCIRSGIDFARDGSSLSPNKILECRNIAEVCERAFSNNGSDRTVGTEMDLLPAAQLPAWQKALGRRELADCSPMVCAQRMIKDAEEIACMRRAAEAAHAGHLAALEVLAPGISELQLAAAVENAQRLAGHEGLHFFRQPDVVMSRGPVGSGPDLTKISGVIFSITGKGLSPAVPAGPSARVLADGDLALVDIPPCVAGYHADQTRMYCAGEPSGREEDLMARLREVSDRLIEGLRPGMSANQAYEMAMARARELDIADWFMRFPAGNKAHFVGHGIGLEIAEPPLLARGNRQTIAENTALALEMHLMTEDGLTLKLEDTVILRPGGCELLTASSREIGRPA